MKKVLLTVLGLAFVFQACAQQNDNAEFTLVVYNVENLFDADGVAVYNDYKPEDRDGNPQYTKEDVLTKIQNAVHVLQQYNNGKGPDVLSLIEVESDFIPTKEYSVSEFISKYELVSLEDMLGDRFNDEIADLPSELLLLKGMHDAGMWPYSMAVGKSELNSKGEPETVQKTVAFSRFPIQIEKTKAHTLHRARPILETWIDVNGADLVVFSNHWKSGASSAEMEQIRLKNAQVLCKRLDELLSENPNLDIVLAGDFNSDYNQSHRYDFEKTAVNDVLLSVGEEEKVAEGNAKEVYNLWYELPLTERGSDTYRGKWGTLMQVMISSGMYDGKGVQYVDNSFEVGDFGFNTYSTSGEPKRWTSTFSGSGYSDHLPISMKFRMANRDVEYTNFSVNDDSAWKPIEVSYTLPTEFITEEEFLAEDPRQQPHFFDQYVHATATVTEDYNFVVGDITFDVYTPSFRLNSVLKELAGTEREIEFYGRLSRYKDNWQFIVESPDFIIKP